MTPRQAEVLELIAAGKETHEIAAELFICEQTVKYHIGELYANLNVRNRIELARWWWVNVEKPPASTLQAMYR